MVVYNPKIIALIMKNNNKTLLQCLFIGLKVGWNTPLLPKYMINIHNHSFTRIFRVIGGISIITVLSKNYLLLYTPLKFVVLLLAFLHFIYITVISMIKLIHGFKVLKSDKLNIKNSPMDHFASLAGKLLFCWKYGCQAGSAGLGLVGTSFMLDSMLEAGNQEKIFTPLIGKEVKFIVGGKPADAILSEIKRNLDEIESNKKRLEEVNKLFDKTNNIMDYKDFSKKEIDSIKAAVEEVKNMEESQLQRSAKELAKKIRDYSNSAKK